MITNSNNIREFFLHPNGDHISGRKKAIEVMREEGGYEKREFDKMIRKMKQVSDRNQNKPSQHQTSDGGWGPGGNSKNDRDTDDDEWRGGSIDPGSFDYLIIPISDCFALQSFYALHILINFDFR